MKDAGEVAAFDRAHEPERRGDDLPPDVIEGLAAALARAIVGALRREQAVDKGKKTARNAEAA